MKRTREEMKADLLAQAEAAIELLIGWSEDTPEPSFAQIEEVVMRLHKQWSEQMAQALLQEQQAAVQSVPGPACLTCGREMRYKGQKAHPVESKVGTVQLQRAYYYCSRCQQGLFPPG